MVDRRVWQRQGDRYQPVARFTEPSAYNSLVEFIYALKSGGDAAAWTTSPWVVKEATDFRVERLPDQVLPILPDGEASIARGPISIATTEQALVFYFAERNGRFYIENIDLLADQTGPASGPMTPPPPPEQHVHIVQPEQNLLSLAARYQIPVEIIRAANGLAPDQDVVPGQAVIIPLDARAPVPTMGPTPASFPDPPQPTATPAPPPPPEGPPVGGEAGGNPEPTAGVSYVPPRSMIDLGDMEIESWTSISPDGAWAATGLGLIFQGKAYYQQLRLSHVDGTAEWTPLAGWQPLALGFTLPAPLNWSADGRYFYFTNTPRVDGCSPFANGSDVQRLDLATGEVVELIDMGSLVIALSPDDRTLAFRERATELGLFDLERGQARLVPLGIRGEATDFGDLTWAPDGQSLGLVVAYNPCGPVEQTKHSILLVDIEQLTVRTLLERDQRRFRITAWADAGLLLRDAAGQIWVIDVATGQVSKQE